MTKSKSGAACREVVWGRAGGRDTKSGKDIGVMVVTVLIMEMMSQVHTYVRTSQVVHFKDVPFIV